MADVDRDTLAAIFASRVSLAKRTEEEAIEDARKEYQRVVKWIWSPARKEGSFLWFCEEFGLEPHGPQGVLTAIRERRK